MNKKILITGGAGFIGSHLAEKLIAQGEEVSIVDNLSTGSKENLQRLLAHKNLHFILQDIRDQEALEPLIAAVDIVYHLAAAVGVQYIIENKVDSLLTNFIGCYHVFSLCTKYNKRVIFTSSSEVYGKNNICPFREDSLTVFGPVNHFRWSYGCSKMSDEHLALSYHKEKGLQVTIVRLFNTVGPKQTGRYGMVIPRFVEKALKNEEIIIYGSGLQRRCFINVSDVVETLIKISENEKTIGEVLNIGSSEEITILDLAKRIIEITKSHSSIKHIDPKDILGNDFEDLERRVPNVNKIKKLIEFMPKNDLQFTLQEIVEHKRKLLFLKNTKQGSNN